MAIAFDASSTSAGGVDPSWSHTCTGSNLCLLVGFCTYDGCAGPTNVKYNNVAMTQVTSQGWTDTALNFTISVWRLPNPSTGANNVTASYTGCGWSSAAVSYTGVHQTTPVDAFSSTTNAGGAPSLTLTTTVANDMIVGFSGSYDPNGNITWTPGTNYTERTDSTGQNRSEEFEERLVTTAQGYTVNSTNSDAAHVGALIAVALQVPSTSKGYPPTLLFMGMG